VEFEAGGSTLVRAPLGDAKAAAREQTLPMSVSAKLKYAERQLANVPSTSDAEPLLAVRHYEIAEAVIKVGEGGKTPRLANDRRLIVVEAGTGRRVLYSPQGALRREQLDLVDTVGDSSVINELLPAEPVAEGGTWPSDAFVMGALLTLDTVAACEVQSVLEEFNDNFAKVRLAGVVHGTADGAATEEEIRGVYLFDRQQRRITRLNLAVREKRAIGGATPGLDAVAKLQITIDPLRHVPQLNDEEIARATKAARTPARDLLYESTTMGFRVEHDRQWFMTSEQRESVILRRVDRSDLVAQCTLAVLPPKSAGRQTTLEQFQKDVVYSLGKDAGQLISARQWQNQRGHYSYEVVVRGKVDALPIEWHYYLVARDGGHRVTGAVTIEGPLVERVAGADRSLIDGLQLFPPMPAVQAAAPSRLLNK
jgi:hypothetical protein